MSNNIYVFSFSIKPTELQPSGSINFSRIDDFNIVMTLDKKFKEYLESIDNSNIFIKIYAVSYNVLRFMSGMAGLAFE